MKTKKRISGEIPELIHHVEVKQRRGVKYNLIVIVVVFALVAIIVSQIYRYLEKRETRDKKVDKMMEALFAESNLDILQDKFTNDLALIAKLIYENPSYRQQSELLNDILRMQKENEEWEKLSSGHAFDTGFNSPTFAAFILEEHGLLGEHRVFDVWYRLEEVIPRTDSPSMGDVVFYEYGYTMFYFMTDSGVPFVIGMTPLGILALKEDFFEKIGYGKINYSKQ